MNPATTPSPRVVEILETLIGFDTVSRNSNLGLIEWVRDYLRKLGVASRLSYDASAKKANLLATLGDGTNGGLMLSGTPTWSRSTASRGTPIPSARCAATAASTAAARPT